MHWNGVGIVCSITAHGETGAIVRLLTPDAGLLAGYVRGGRSKTSRATLQIGNVVTATWHARVEDQLGHYTLELTRSCLPAVLGNPIAASVISWTTALPASLLPDRDPHPGLFKSLLALLDEIDAGKPAAMWLGDVVRFELQMLSDLGYGLDLTSCVATGTMDDLAYVSPKSSQAVCQEAGRPYADRLLPLPAFLCKDARIPTIEDLAAGLRLTGHFLLPLLPSFRRQALEALRYRLSDLILSRYKQNHD